ncbi:MAG: flagellar basal body rod protein FlgC [Clostridia bacterium]|nr:flagellar basal body rod protein FlgC [Clostridia bacterium]
MGFLSGMDISASGLTAQRLRMDVISENIANIDTTRTEDGGPYTRKYVVMEAREERFSDILQNAAESAGGGVRVSEIGEDSSEYKLVYEPDNPDADEDGYVEYPNVDVTQEMVDMISAYRSYEANVTAFSAYKDMAIKTLEIGT